MRNDHSINDYTKYCIIHFQKFTFFFLSSLSLLLSFSFSLSLSSFQYLQKRSIYKKYFIPKNTFLFSVLFQNFFPSKKCSNRDVIKENIFSFSLFSPSFSFTFSHLFLHFSLSSSLIPSYLMISLQGSLSLT